MQKIYQDTNFTIYQKRLEGGFLIITVMSTGATPVMSTVFVPEHA